MCGHPSLPLTPPDFRFCRGSGAENTVAYESIPAEIIPLERQDAKPPPGYPAGSGVAFRRRLVEALEQAGLSGQPDDQRAQGAQVVP